MTNTPSPKLASNLYYFLHSGAKFELKFAIKFGAKNQKKAKIITAKALYASARFRSLLLSISGVLLGSGVACDVGAFRADIFALALLTTLLFQVLSDYANDYGDAVKGTDDDGRLGPRRAIQTGQMSAAEMKRVIVATALLSALCSLALSVSAFGEVLSCDAIFGAGRHVDIRGDPLCRGRWRIRIPGAWRHFRVFFSDF